MARPRPWSKRAAGMVDRASYFGRRLRAGTVSACTKQLPRVPFAGSTIAALREGAIWHASQQGDLDYGWWDWDRQGIRDRHGGPFGPHRPLWASSIRTR